MKPFDLLNNDGQELAKKQYEIALEYASAREKAGEARKELYTFLIPQLKEYRKGKKNLGKEMAIFMIAEENEHAKQAFMDMLKWEDKYKGLEVILDAIKSRVSFYQSIMKYQIEGERLG